MHRSLSHLDVLSLKGVSSRAIYVTSSALVAGTFLDASNPGVEASTDAHRLSTIYYLPLFWQAVDGFTATQAGIRLLPGIAAGVSGSLFGGIVMQKTGNYYWMTVSAYVILTTGMLPILLYSGLVGNSTYGISVGMVLCGFSNGIGVTTTLIGLIANAAHEDQAIATACSYLFRSLGSVVGLSLSATVVQQVLRNRLQDQLGSGVDADKIVENVRRSLDFIKTLSPELAELVRKCYGSAIRAGYGFLIGVVALAAMSSCKYKSSVRFVNHLIGVNEVFIREKKLGR